MGFPPKFAEGLVSHKFSLKVMPFFRSTNSTRNIKKNTRKNSRPKVRHFRSVGTNSRRTPNSPNKQNKQNLLRNLRINLRSSKSKKLLRKFKSRPHKRRSHSK